MPLKSLYLAQVENLSSKTDPVSAYISGLRSGNVSNMRLPCVYRAFSQHLPSAIVSVYRVPLRRIIPSALASVSAFVGGPLFCDIHRSTVATEYSCWIMPISFNTTEHMHTMIKQSELDSLQTLIVKLDPSQNIS